MSKIRYSMKKYSTYKVGTLVCRLDERIRKILKENKNGCLKDDMCFPGTVGHIESGYRGDRISFCPHNVTHIDRPEHIYASHLIDLYEERLDFISKIPLGLIIVDERDLLGGSLGISGGSGQYKACLVKKNNLVAGLKLFSDQMIRELKNNNVLVLMTDCLSVDPLDFPANSLQSNHFRLMSEGIIVIEVVPTFIVNSNIKKIMVNRIFATSKFIDAEPISISAYYLS